MSSQGNNKETLKELEDQLRDLEHMAELALLLKKKREERGSLDFDLPEPEVILDIEGGLQEYHPVGEALFTSDHRGIYGLCQ